MNWREAFTDVFTRRALRGHRVHYSPISWMSGDLFFNAAACQHVFHLPCPAPRRWWAGAPRASVCRRAWTGSPTGSPCYTDASHQTLPGLQHKGERDKEQIRPGASWGTIQAKQKCLGIVKLKRNKTNKQKKTTIFWMLKKCVGEAWLTACFW